MEPRPRSPRLSALQKVGVRQRATLLARLQTVQLLQMSERDIAELVKQVEADPLFQKLLYAPTPSWKVLRFQPHPRTRLAGSFYEMNEETLPSGARPEAGVVLSEGREALALIRKIGQENFERYFLKADTDMDRPALAAALGLNEPDIQKIRDFMLSYSIQAEFFDAPPRGPGAQRVVRLATLALNAAGEPEFEFRSPLLARGRYDIQYERLQSLLKGPQLAPQERRHLRAFVRRLELINWRQNTLYRILDFLCHAQRRFLASREPTHKSPLTQRSLARHLAVAPSTINRAIQGRSVVLPWREEVLLEDLFCTRKSLCVDVLESLAAEDADFAGRTDEQLQARLKERLGLPVPRRTVNSYRRLLEKSREA